MATYYTYAKSRKGNVLKVPIESKHVYDNTSFITGGTIGDVFAGPDGNKAGFKAESSTSKVLYCSNYGVTTEGGVGFRWEQGSGPNEIIGDKIMVKSVNFHFEFALNNDVLATFGDSDLSYNTSQYNMARQHVFVKNNDPSDDMFNVVYNQAWRRDYRVQVIHFEDDLPQSLALLKVYLAKWYDSTYVPSVIGLTSQSSGADQEYGNTNVISNKAKMLRESTGYTGKFKILKDFSFSLSPHKTYEIIDFSLDPKSQVSMASEKEGEEPNVKEYWYITNDWWLNTVVVLWQPMNYDLDMDPLSSSHYKSNALQSASNQYNSVTIGNYRWCIKLTYYDV